MSGTDQIKQHVFQWKSSTLFYRVWGNGPELVIAFHGYGLDGSSFIPVTSMLEQTHTIVAIDLPFQGRTRWRETDALSRSELKELIYAFLDKIEHTGKVSLLAYSIGGNYALGLTAQCPERIKQVVLIAADGLKFKPLFWYITSTFTGKAIFSGFVYFPQPVFFLIRLGRWLGLFPPRVLNFFYESISTRNKRAALRMRWVSVGRILPRKSTLVSVLNRNHMPVKLLFGRKDHVIPVKNAEKFAQSLNNATLVILEQGHQLLHKGNAEVLQRLFK